MKYPCSTDTAYAMFKISIIFFNASTQQINFNSFMFDQYKQIQSDQRFWMLLKGCDQMGDSNCSYAKSPDMMRRQ